MASKTGRGLMALVLVMGLVMFMGSPVAAITHPSCDTSQGANWFDTMARDATSDHSWDGASGKIQAQVPTVVCSTNGDTFSAAWIAMGDTNPNSSNFGGIAQIGIARGYTNNVDTFHFHYCWDKDGAGTYTCDDFGGTPVAGLHYAMRVTYFDGSNADHHLHMQSDFDDNGVWSDIAETNFDPYASGGWSWKTPVFFEEFAWQPSHQMGTTSDDVNFTVSKIRPNDATWHDANWYCCSSNWRIYANNGHDQGGSAVISDAHMAMWDTRD